MSPLLDDVTEPTEENVTDITTLPDTPITEAEAVDEEYPRLPSSAFAILAPMVRSRWVACIARFDEDVAYRDFDRVGGIAEPAIVRTPASVGTEYAQSCIGVPISCHTQENGLRSGRVELARADGSSQLVAPTVGFIEQAVATPQGIVAVLAILSDEMHKDLRALADRGELGLCQICVIQRAQVVRSVTAWGIAVWAVASVRARLCQLTSLSHVMGQTLTRQLAPGESLSAEDLDLLPRERRWLPAACGGSGAVVVVADISPNAITTAKRQLLGSSSFGWTVPANGDISVPVFHGLGVIPIVIVDSGAGAVVGTAFAFGPTQVTVHLVNIRNVDLSGTATVYFM
jgi:hypothetical protein